MEEEKGGCRSWKHGKGREWGEWGGLTFLKTNEEKELPRKASRPDEDIVHCPRCKQSDLTCDILCFMRYPLYQSAKRKIKAKVFHFLCIFC